MMLIAPIYDRTLADAQKAARQPEIAHLHKGALRVDDFIRIEANTDYLAQRVCTEIGFQPSQSAGITDAKTLGYASLVNRVAQNIEQIRLTAIHGVTARWPESIPLPGYETLKTDFTGGIGTPTIDYRTVNAWEKNQAVLDRLITRITAAFRYSGAHISGSAVCLPMGVVL